jgi:predicted Zn-dependent protease
MKLNRTRILIAAALVAVLLAAGAGVVWVKRSRRPPPLTDPEAYALGQKALEAKHYAEALHYLDPLALRHPGNLDYCWPAARAALALGRKPTALPHLRASWEGGMKNKTVLLALADCTPFKTPVERQKAVLDWLQKFPEGPERRELEADVHFEASRYDEAIKQWEEAAKVAPTGRLTTKMAMAQLGAGKRDAAQTRLQSQRGTPLSTTKGTAFSRPSWPIATTLRGPKRSWRKARPSFRTESRSGSRGRPTSSRTTAPWKRPRPSSR